MDKDKQKRVIIVHGGAGIISKERCGGKLSGVLEAVRIGYRILMSTDNPMDAVEEAIKSMEVDENFNAGYGSVLTRDGDVEQDALIIRGSDLKAGGVGAIKHVRHAISVARAVMEKTEHALLVGNGAEQFAKDEGFPIIDSQELISPRSKELLELILKDEAKATTEIPHSVPKKLTTGEGGTVGAIAINSLGEIVAGTSTGGIGGKLPGRVGDTPIIGGGTFCDDSVCGVSATGLGEAIMKACVCSRVAENLKLGQSPNDAILSAVDYMKLKIPEGEGGAILITHRSEVGCNFNSDNLAWAYIKEGESEIHYGISKGDDFTTSL